MEVNPEISVIIATENGGRFLRQTLYPVVQQSFTGYEQVNSYFYGHLSQPRLAKL